MQTNETVTFQGNPLHLTGAEIAVGSKAPEFTLAGNDMSPKTLAFFSGKTIVLVTVPSLDTPVCDMETRRFNAEAGKLKDDVVVLIASMDLPFAQARWCGAAGIKNVQTASDYKEASLGLAYGVLIKELRLLARTIFIIDSKGIVRYKQIVPEITHEPNYDAVLNALKNI